MQDRPSGRPAVERLPLTLSVGQEFGRYELLSPVARGGMGQVWVGRLRGARGFHKLVAVKTLLPAGGNDERMERMLLEEARIAALIQHTNVVQTLELGEHEGTLYLIMEWVDGEPLSYVLSRAAEGSGVPPLVAVNLIAQTLRGLQAAHELTDDTGAPLGVVHRDVSPHNVLVSYSGVAKLVDFGIAKAMNQMASSTATGEIKGKFAYMAPEQILGEAVDQRADLFAVGIMLYLLTTGRHPFKNHNSAGVLHSITSEEPAPRPSLLVGSYSRLLESVVMKALEKDPERRWPSAEEMRLALQRAVPQAFTPGFESQLRSFMTDTVGDRATNKREALRRAELAADAHIKDSGSLAAAGGTAQSASSLRAVSVDDGDAPASPRLSRAPTLRPPEARPVPRRSRHWWLVGAAALGTLTFGLASLHRRDAARSAAASPGAGMVNLAQSSASHSLGAPTSSAALETVPGVAVPSPSAGAVPAASGSAPTLAGGASSLRKIAAPRRVPRAAPAHTADLIAPDYAR